MKISYLLFALCLSNCLAGVSQEHAAVTAQPNTLYVSADGKFEADPDTAQIQFTISAQEDTSDGAYQRASRSAARMREVLKVNSVDPKAAELGFYSLQPTYDWKTAKNRVLGYRVSSSVTIRLHDFDKVGALVQGLASIEDTEGQSLNYTLENIDAAKIKAAEDAIHKAHNLADAVAKAEGRTLGELIYSSVDAMEQISPIVMGVATPMARTMSTQAAEPTAGFSPKKISVSSHVTAIFAMR